MRGIQEAKDRVRSQGNRTSQIVYGLTEEYGILTGLEVADVVGVSKQYMYRVANKAGVRFQTGRRPVRINKDLIESTQKKKSSAA